MKAAKVNKAVEATIRRMIEGLDNVGDSRRIGPGEPGDSIPPMSVEYISDFSPPAGYEQFAGREYSFCTYCSMNGDLMRDPEIILIVTENGVYPSYWRNDFAHFELRLIYSEDGKLMLHSEQRGAKAFVSEWLSGGTAFDLKQALKDLESESPVIAQSAEIESWARPVSAVWLPCFRHIAAVMKLATHAGDASAFFCYDGHGLKVYITDAQYCLSVMNFGKEVCGNKPGVVRLDSQAIALMIDALGGISDGQARPFLNFHKGTVSFTGPFPCFEAQGQSVLMDNPEFIALTAFFEEAEVSDVCVAFSKEGVQAPHDGQIAFNLTRTQALFGDINMLHQVTTLEVVDVALWKEDAPLIAQTIPASQFQVAICAPWLRSEILHNGVCVTWVDQAGVGRIPRLRFEIELRSGTTISTVLAPSDVDTPVLAPADEGAPDWQLWLSTSKSWLRAIKQGKTGGELTQLKQAIPPMEGDIPPDIYAAFQAFADFDQEVT